MLEMYKMFLSLTNRMPVYINNNNFIKNYQIYLSKSIFLNYEKNILCLKNNELSWLLTKYFWDYSKKKNMHYYKFLFC